MKSLFQDSPQLVVQQVKEMFEILIDWETANRYQFYSKDGVKTGYAAEKTNGVLHKIVRNILRSHRPLTIDVWNNEKKHLLVGRRPFYWLFSDLLIKDNNDSVVGEIKTRFGVLKRKYDLLDERGRVFAEIESPRWRLWTFFILNRQGRNVGEISKKWSGILKETFSDSDKFVIDFSKKQWSENQKAVLLYACLCIDLDFFEDNSNSALSLFD